MIARLIKKLGGMPRTIQRDELEDLVSTMMSEGKKSINDTLKELSKVDESLFNTRAVTFLSGKIGNARKPREILTALGKLNDNLFKCENDIKTMISELPEVITTKHTTTQVAAICNMVNDISTYINFQMDYFYLLVLDTDAETQYSDAKIKEMWSVVPTFVSIITFISNINNELATIKKLDNNIIINEDNKSSQSLLSKERLPFIPVNDLSINPIAVIYSIRVWMVDREIKKYELLKEKKALLELRVLELKKKAAGDPTDTKIKKAIDVYIDKIEDAEYRIKKIEDL